jgi:hypothetical protein
VEKKKILLLSSSFSINKWPCFGLLINGLICGSLINGLIFWFLIYKWVVNKWIGFWVLNIYIRAYTNLFTSLVESSRACFV